MIRLVKYIWEKISQSHAIKNAGPLENVFFESVYRLVFVAGLSTSDDYFLYTIFCTYIKSTSSLFVCLEIWYLFSDDLILDDMISSANAIFIHLITIWKMMTVVSNKKVLNKLAKALDLPSFDISSQKRKDIVKHWANTHHKYLSVLMIIAFSTLFFWQTYPLIDEVEYNLMVAIKLPWELNGHLLRYIVTYLVVGTIFQCTSFIVIMSEVIMQSHLIPLICQFDVLADCFENIFEECVVEFQASFPEINRHELVKNNMFVDKYLKRLGDLVKQYQAILDQAMELKTIISIPMLGQLACSGFLICFIGYQATTAIAENFGKFAMSLFYLIYNMFTLYLICRWCEEITLQSQYVGRAAYFSGWESGMSLVPGVRATIILVIARSNKPLVFLAGGMYPLSLSSYTTLVKASYSALNIILAKKE